MATKADIEAERDALRADLAIIGERLKQEAIDRAWCAEYDQIMNEINGQTSEAHMKPCITSTEVVIEGEVAIKFSLLEVEVETEQDDGVPTAAEIDDAVRTWVLGNVINGTGALDYITGVTITESRVG